MSIASDWSDYDRAIQRTARSIDVDSFDKEQFVTGRLDLSPDAIAIIANAQRIEFSSNLTTSGYVTVKFDHSFEKEIRRGSHFRVIDGSLKQLMKECIVQLRDPVAGLLCAPWRVLNVRVWTTPPRASGSGMYAFHNDGFPKSIFKIMIYFTPMDQDHGSLEIEIDGTIKMLSGPAGSWVLFYNSSVMHRGLPGVLSERASAEITLSRSREFDLALRQPGLNAHYPVKP